MVALETACEGGRQLRGVASGRSPASAVGTVSVTRHDAAGTWLIALGGEHDLSTAALLEEETIGVWPCAALVVVDLSGAAFMDSTVVHWLISAKRELEACGTGALRIVEGPGGSFAARLFGLLSVGDVLVCYRTRRDAFGQESALGVTAD
ncbi:MAG: STAS domain-containing protein [Actinomycetota bacterium]|nr:STAS domain-containing protein [Actinomycetota bacterium]